MTVLASPPVVSLERVTIGRYDLLLELGRGGMAVLYLARARGVGGFARMFAIKRILPHLAADPMFVEMFLEEGRIAARLSHPNPHPNLCPVFELGQDRGELFLVMDYLDGVAWDALAAAAPRDLHGLALAAGVLAQACDGLHHAHTFRDVDGTPLPIVHRDVSPQNLFVSADGTCRVLDFGVSKIASDPRRTRSGVRKGKLPYMAPEHVRGDAVDGRADVWALGVMLWEALTGQRLFDRDTDFLTYQAITDAEIPSVNACVPGARYPAAVDRVLARALARDPDHRHASARELAADLARLAAEVGGAAPREVIADAVTRLCGDQLTARRRAIADAVARRGAAEAAASAAADAVATSPGGRAAGGDGAVAATEERDAAATVSMAMRRDAIVVGRDSRRGRPRWLAGALGIAAIAGGIAAVLALSPASSPPAAPPGTVAGSDPPAPAARTTPSASSAPPAAAAAAPGPPRTSPPAVAASRSRAADAAAPAVPPAPLATTSPGAPARPGSPVRAAPPPPAAASHHHVARTVAADRPPAPAASSGWYAIDSAPYATIFIDDRKIGDTPLDRIPLAAGVHRVRAVLADGRQRTFAIDIASERKTSAGTLRW